MTRKSSNFSIQQMLDNERDSMQRLPFSSNLFWENTFFEQQNDFIEKQVGDFVLLYNGIQNSQNSIALYPHPATRVEHIPNMNGKGEVLQIFPQYVFLQGSYCMFVQIINMQNIYDMKRVFVHLLHISGVQVKVFLKNIDKTQLMHELNTNLRVIQAQTATTTSTSIQTHLQKVTQNEIVMASESLLLQANSFFDVNFLIRISAQTKQQLLEQKNRIKQIIQQYNMELNEYIFEQKVAFEKYFLQYIEQASTKRLVIDKKQAAFLLPMAKLTLNDVNGHYIGRDKFDNKIYFDMWIRTQQRVNSNFMIIGQSGMGKTTLLQTLIRTQHKMKLFLLDVEDEYHESFFEEEGYQKYEIVNDTSIYDWLSSHELSNKQCDLLLNQFKILANPSYKILMEFDSLLAKFRKNDNNSSLLGFFLESYQKRTISIEIMQFILSFERRSKLAYNPNKTVQHFVVKEAAHTNNGTIQLAFFELLFYLWEQMLADTTEHKMLVIEESYFIFDKDNYFTVELLRNIAKRARKYNVSLVIITQNLMDFMHPDLQHLLLPIFDNCTYKFLFYPGENDWYEYQKRFQLDEYGSTMLKQLTRGEALLFAGYNYGKVKVRKIE